MEKHQEQALRTLVYSMAHQLELLLKASEREKGAEIVRYGLDALAEAMEREDFEPAISVLEIQGLEPLFEHTGGNVYVLYHYPSNSIDLRVGISPWESDDPFEAGTWLVCGYADEDDDGQTFMEQAVPTSDLYRIVTMIGEKLMANQPTTGSTYEIPGRFYVKFVDGKPEFRWVPHAGDAGYFGAEAINADTGEIVPEDMLKSFWSAVSAGLDEDEFQAYWEG